MNKLITKDIFIEIFKNSDYRYKLDKIILNFFGLEPNKNETINLDSKEEIILEFLFFIDTEYVLSIKIKDTKKLFKSSKKFYLNMSYENLNRYHKLVVPCYWEIYCPFAYEKITNDPKILLIAALLFSENVEEISKILMKLEMFSEEEILDIIHIIEINK